MGTLNMRAMEFNRQSDIKEKERHLREDDIERSGNIESYRAINLIRNTSNYLDKIKTLNALEIEELNIILNEYGKKTHYNKLGYLDLEYEEHQMWWLKLVTDRFPLDPYDLEPSEGKMYMTNKELVAFVKKRNENKDSGIYMTDEEIVKYVKKQNENKNLSITNQLNSKITGVPNPCSLNMRAMAHNRQIDIEEGKRYLKKIDIERDGDIESHYTINKIRSTTTYLEKIKTLSDLEIHVLNAYLDKQRKLTYIDPTGYIDLEYERQTMYWLTRYIEEFPYDMMTGERIEFNDYIDENHVIDG